MKTTERSVESYVLALSVRSAVDVVGGGGADRVVAEISCVRLVRKSSLPEAKIVGAIVAEIGSNRQ